MLYELNVKNLALIDKEEIEFSKGLNILSGETGAGKSIILGALNLALGGKANKAMLRDEESDALVEAVFSADPSMTEFFKSKDMDVDTEEVILSRKITQSRTSARINGETVPAPALEEAGTYLIDIYGQHDHQSLLNKKKHLELLDEFSGQALAEKKDKLAAAYKKYREIKEKYEGANLNAEERQKELLFLEHEAGEIENANISPGEDEELEHDYRKLKNSKKIMADIGEAYELIGADGAAAEAVGRALKNVISANEFDDDLAPLADSLGDIDSLLADAVSELSDYINDSSFDEERFAEVESRLDVINTLKEKYGPSLEDVLEELDKKKRRIEELNDYDGFLRNLERDHKKAEEELEKLCLEVSDMRRENAAKLCDMVREALLELNFLDVKFSMGFKRTPEFSANGYDDAEFMISTNPGSPLRPLKNIASGGELSRVMLSLKTVMAASDSRDTLIFDEIDAGISGRTAQAVAEKLAQVAKGHQVICITHLPQIAAYADRHFLIEKHVEDESTISSIHPLDEDEQIEELARMLGGSQITQAALDNARDLKKRAKK